MRIIGPLFVLVLALSTAATAASEADRLWLVGERAFTDGFHPSARRALEQFVARHPTDSRAPDALLLWGQSVLSLGEPEVAVRLFQRAQGLGGPRGYQLDARLLEADAQVAAGRAASARDIYAAVLRDQPDPALEPRAFYGLAITDLELQQPDAAMLGLRGVLARWPTHRLAPSAAFHLARTLIEQRRLAEAVDILSGLATRHPSHAVAPRVDHLLTGADGLDVDARTRAARRVVAGNPGAEFLFRIARGGRTMVNIVIPSFAGTGERSPSANALAGLATEVGVLLTDSKRFAVIAGISPLPVGDPAAHRRVLADFRDAGAQAVLLGSVTPTRHGLESEIRLYDITSTDLRLIAAQTFRVPAAQYRQLAQEIARAMIVQFGGEARSR